MVYVVIRLMNQFTGNGETDGFIGAVPKADAVTDLGSSSKRWRNGNFVNVSTTGSVTAAAVDVQSGVISNVGDPVALQDASTKNYVDVADVLMQSDIGTLQTDAVTLQTKTQSLSVLTTPGASIQVSDQNLSSNTSNSNWLATQSSVYQNHVNHAWRTADSNFNTWWQSGSSTYLGTSTGAATNTDSFDPGTGAINGSWIKFALLAPQLINSYKMRSPNGQPEDWTIYTSLDDVTYSVADSRTGEALSQVDYSPVFTMSETSARYIVLHITKIPQHLGNSAGVVTMSEFVVYKTDAASVVGSSFVGEVTATTSISAPVVNIDTSVVSVVDSQLQCEIASQVYHIAGGNKVSKTFDMEGGGNNTVYVGEFVTLRWANPYSLQYIVSGAQTDSYSFTMSYNHNTSGTADFKYVSGVSTYNGYRYFTADGLRNAEFDRASSGGRYDFTLKATTDNTKPSLIGTIFHGDPTEFATILVEQIYPA